MQDARQTHPIQPHPVLLRGLGQIEQFLPLARPFARRHGRAKGHLVRFGDDELGVGGGVAHDGIAEQGRVGRLGVGFAYGFQGGEVWIGPVQLRRVIVVIAVVVVIAVILPIGMQYHLSQQLHRHPPLLRLRHGRHRGIEPHHPHAPALLPPVRQVLNGAIQHLQRQSHVRHVGPFARADDRGVYDLVALDVGMGLPFLQHFQ
mmetsp:Transcript_16118/g.34828  ORF Transcript_16118/g.34828 Transcript_16118/m.34828 type:complete len:203 (+) Transcript_16118:1528-2136(+)